MRHHKLDHETIFSYILSNWLNKLWSIRFDQSVGSSHGVKFKDIKQKTERMSIKLLSTTVMYKSYLIVVTDQLQVSAKHTRSRWWSWHNRSSTSGTWTCVYMRKQIRLYLQVYKCIPYINLLVLFTFYMWNLQS